MAGLMSGIGIQRARYHQLAARVIEARRRIVRVEPGVAHTLTASVAATALYLVRRPNSEGDPATSAATKAL